MTLPFEQLAESLRIARDYRGHECGAYIQGINMEGPYISAAKKAPNAEILFESLILRSF